MFLSLVGQESDVDAFRFFLAVKLGCQVGDLDRMSYREYADWMAYFECTGAMSNMKRVI